MKEKSGKFGPRLTVSLTGRDYATLNALAEREQVSASWLIRRAINEYLQNHRDESEQAAPPAAFGKGTAFAAGQHQDR
jgi:metal-responsive CopG/Arc/MetJ family transcriptional regulator